MSAVDKDSRLQAYLDGELDEAARAEVERELGEAEPLRAELERLRSAAELVRGSKLPELPDNLISDVTSRVTIDGQRWWERLLPGAGRPFPTLAWGTVSTVLLAVVLLPLSEFSLGGSRDVYSTVSDSMVTRADSFYAAAPPEAKSEAPTWAMPAPAAPEAGLPAVRMKSVAPGAPGGPAGSSVALHGVFVVSDGHGGFTTELTQNGTLTTVTDTSVTARSEDGFTQTYVVTTDTRTGRSALHAGEKATIRAVQRDGANTATVISPTG